MRRGFNTHVIDRLTADGIITKNDIASADKVREQQGGRTEDILVTLGLVGPDDMLSYRALELETVPVHFDSMLVPRDVLTLIPRELASRYLIIPIFRTPAVLTAAMANPLNINAIDDIERSTGLRIVPMLSSEKQIETAIKRLYKPSMESVSTYLKKIQPGDELQTLETETEPEIEDSASLEKLAQDAPVVGLVNLILSQAIQDGISDVHVETYQNRLRVRYRKDGVLEEVDSPPKQLHPAIVSRIKIMSGMDISERRQPQDGRMKINMPMGSVNLRVSSLPTMFGEKVVMRVSDESRTLLGLDELGMSKDVLQRYIQSLEKPHGMILVTGPTGSGKTATLYASLNRINTPDVNIISLEDPVEYLMDGINQVEINDKAGRSFANVLRSVLRQDPDIVMVGEIRDHETADLGVEAALTGHLVFSTLHTNDAPSAIIRLVDLGVEPFLISASVSCIMAQRLVRLLCPHCKKAYKPSQEVIDLLKLPPGDYTFFERQGCHLCNEDGYKGRKAVYEVMFMNDEIKELTSLKGEVKAIQEVAIRDGMQTLRQAAIEDVVAGITWLNEAFRVTAE
jgi:type IV pilus assembly protein PilB